VRSSMTEQRSKVDQLEKKECTDAPRNLFHLVKARWSEEQRAQYPEVKDEKAFRTFLHACLPGGEHHERASRYFNTTLISWEKKKEVKFKLTFNPACIPVPESTPAEDEELWNFTDRLRVSSSFAWTAEPPKEPLQVKLQRWHEQAMKAFENGEPGFDACHDAEARIEAENNRMGD
jgi:hypothetical protein